MHYFLKIFIFVAAVLLFFSYIAYSIPSRPSLPPEEGKINFEEVRTKEDLVSLGQKIFFGKGQCALCHSFGHSVTARCPDLEGIGAKLTREFIYESLTQPSTFVYKQYEYSPAKPFGAQMPQIDKPPIGLNQNEILAVIAFVQNSGGREYVTVDPSELVKPAEAVLAASGDAGKGQLIYRNLGCRQCHGTEGEGLMAQKKDPLHLLSVLRSEAYPDHKGLDTRLTLRDLNDLIAYLSQIKIQSESLKGL